MNQSRNLRERAYRHVVSEQVKTLVHDVGFYLDFGTGRHEDVQDFEQVCGNPAVWKRPADLVDWETVSSSFSRHLAHEPLDEVDLLPLAR